MQTTDVYKPVNLAKRYSIVLACICFLFALCTGVATLFLGIGAAGGAGGQQAAGLGIVALVILAVAGIYLAAGITLIFVYRGIAQWRGWAPIVGIVIGSIIALFSLFSLVAGALSPDGQNIVGLLVSFVTMLVGAMYIKHCADTKKVMANFPPPGQVAAGGFQPVMPGQQPGPPPVPSGGSGPNAPPPIQ